MDFRFCVFWSLQQLWRLPALLLIPFFLLFARKTGTDSDDIPGPQYRQLPRWLFWASTPDQRLPGDLRIDRVRWLYENFGWFIAAWYWLAWRNVGHGIMWCLGKPCTNYLVHLSLKEKANLGVYERTKRFGPLLIISGWKIVLDRYNLSSKTGFWAIPRVSIRFKR